MMLISVKMCLLGVSYRVIAETFLIFHNIFDFLWKGFTCPAYTTHRLWSLRYSLSHLTRKKDLTDEICLIADHTVKIGSLKCLIGMGVSLTKLREKGNFIVSHEDMIPLIIEPVRSSSGELVFESLTKAAHNAGIKSFTQFLTDNASDLTKGGKIYKEIHLKTKISTDITHEKGILLKCSFSNDPLWLEYTKLMNMTMQTLKQGEWAVLMPPHQRKKGRYLNADIGINWGIEKLEFLKRDNHCGMPQKEIAKLEWLYDYETWLFDAQQRIRVCEIAEEMVIYEGYHCEIVKEYKKKIKAIHLSSESKEIVKKMECHLKKSGQSIQKSQAILGCTNAIESIIGKGKALDRGPSEKDFTPRVLLHAGIVCEPTLENVKEALESTKTLDLYGWINQLLKKSMNTMQRIFFPRIRQKQ
jgi:hypothetical protein